MINFKSFSSGILNIMLEFVTEITKPVSVSRTELLQSGKSLSEICQRVVLAQSKHQLCSSLWLYSVPLAYEALKNQT